MLFRSVRWVGWLLGCCCLLVCLVGSLFVGVCLLLVCLFGWGWLVGCFVCLVGCHFFLLPFAFSGWKVIRPQALSFGAISCRPTRGVLLAMQFPKASDDLPKPTSGLRAEEVHEGFFGSAKRPPKISGSWVSLVQEQRSHPWTLTGNGQLSIVSKSCFKLF